LHFVKLRKFCSNEIVSCNNFTASCTFHGLGIVIVVGTPALSSKRSPGSVVARKGVNMPISLKRGSSYISVKINPLPTPLNFCSSTCR
jgi:hypothetical protein